jgi:hypothetical protein
MRNRPLQIVGAVALAIIAPASAQNVIDRSEPRIVLERATLPHDLVEQLIIASDVSAGLPQSVPPQAERILAKMERHIRELIDGWPWRPLHHLLGISGAETYFTHPDELFHALGLAFPFLSEPLKSDVARFLRARLGDAPPYATDGFDLNEGRTREAYSVPESLRRKGRGAARSAFGVAAFALCIRAMSVSGHEVAVEPHWAAICARMDPLRDSYRFDPGKKGDGSDEAERLNGELAGWIAFARLARMRNEPALFVDMRVRPLAQLRVDLERINPHFVEPTAFASKRLHNFKLGRYCGLTDAVAALFDEPTRELAATRLRTFRTQRNGWHLALGERMIGGENYTNPLHFGRALFAGAALLGQLPSDELLGFIDVPECKADFYFIEKCALALRAASR